MAEIFPGGVVPHDCRPTAMGCMPHQILASDRMAFMRGHYHSPGLERDLPVAAPARPCFFALAAPPLWSPIQDIFTPAFITVYIHNKTRGIRSMYVVRMIAYYYINIIRHSRSYGDFPKKIQFAPGIVNQGRRFIFPVHCNTF